MQMVQALRRPLAAGAAALALVSTGLAATFGEGHGDGDAAVSGASFSVVVYANTVRGTPRTRRGVTSIAFSNRVRTDGSTRVVFRGVLRRPGGETASYVAELLRWSLRFTDERLALEFAIRVTDAAGEPGCVEGAKGTLTLVDDDERLSGGASSDSARVRFSGSGCDAFERTWSNQPDPTTKPRAGGPGGGQRARVEIVVEHA
jgi:hypothetical protein